MEEDQISFGIITYHSLCHRKTLQTVAVFVHGDLLAMDYTHILNLQPTDNGLEDIEGGLFPCKMLNFLPGDLFMTCKFKTGCQRKVCPLVRKVGNIISR